MMERCMEQIVEEKIESLNIKGLKIIQNKKWFCFGMDAVLISDFADIKKTDTVVDLGTGTGIIPLLIWGKKEPVKIYGVEIQPEMVELAKKSVSLNHLEDQIHIIHMDMKSLSAQTFEKVDVVVSNPPYIEYQGGIVNPESQKALARHEIACDLEDVINAAARILKQQGSFFMIHRPYRLVDIFSLMRKHRLEPKKIRFVHPKEGQKPNMIMIKGVKGGKMELQVEPPLYVYNHEGVYTKELLKIYELDDQS